MIRRNRYTLEQAQLSESIGDHMNIDHQWLIHEIKYLQSENVKLKQLLLLTDPAVSNVEMNSLTLAQWKEFTTWEEELNGKN